MVSGHASVDLSLQVLGRLYQNIDIHMLNVNYIQVSQVHKIMACVFTTRLCVCVYMLNQTVYIQLYCVYIGVKFVHIRAAC